MMDGTHEVGCTCLHRYVLLLSSRVERRLHPTPAAFLKPFPVQRLSVSVAQVRRLSLCRTRRDERCVGHCICK